MFGVSFQELLLMAVVALLILGPKKLPTALRTVGKSIRKLRNLTSEVRQQSGIDDVLREEGFAGGLNELRSVMRGGTGWRGTQNNLPASQDHNPARFVADLSREYPVEGPDAYDVLPEDLLAPAAPPIAPNANSAEELSVGSTSDAAQPKDNEAMVANAPLDLSPKSFGSGGTTSTDFSSNKADK